MKPTISLLPLQRDVENKTILKNGPFITQLFPSENKLKKVNGITT